MKRLPFTASTLTLLLLLAPAASARADRVVLLPAGGTAEEELRQDVEQALVGAIFAVGQEAVSEARALDVTHEAEPPSTANEMRAVAEMQNAQWVVVPTVTPLRGQYRLHLRVGYAAVPRVEEIEVLVLQDNEESRLRDVMGALLRPEGLGDDAVRLTEPPGEGGGDQGPQDDTEDVEGADDEEARRRAEEEERRREEFLERERRVQEEERRLAQEAWEARERYGERSPWMFNVGMDVRPIVAHQEVIVDGEDRGGGVLGGLSLRLGRSFQQVPGLELRGVLDLTTGASSGFGLGAGAVYLFSPWAETPVFIGPGVEVGVFQFVTGNTVPSLFVRGGPVGVWRATEDLYIEASLPELQVLTANGGVVTLGLSVRGGFRF